MTPPEALNGQLRPLAAEIEGPPAKAVSGRWNVASLIDQAGEASGLPFSTT